jgi:hypothetical protein
MPSEWQMWDALRPSMDRAGLDPVRIENRVAIGTPDVEFIGGWAELKHADKWPVRGGPLRLPHPPSPAQLVWLLRRWTRGGAAWLILRVAREWFVFRAPDAFELWRDGRAPKQDELRAVAAGAFKSPDEVAAFLRAGR